LKKGGKEIKGERNRIVGFVGLFFFNMKEREKGRGRRKMIAWTIRNDGKVIWEKRKEINI
jgi:hypothetical protein